MVKQKCFKKKKKKTFSKRSKKAKARLVILLSQAKK